MEIYVNNMNLPPLHAPAPATVVVVGPAAYSVDGIEIDDTGGLFEALQTQRAERIELRIAHGENADYACMGKLIFALSRHGWTTESPDSMHWIPKPAGRA